MKEEKEKNDLSTIGIHNTQPNPNIKNDDSHEKQSILISSVR